MPLYHSRRTGITMPIRFGLTLLLLACGCSIRALGSPFDDIPRTHWAYAAYDRLVKAGVRQWPVSCCAMSEARCYPNRHYGLTRYEFAVMTQRALDTLRSQPVSSPPKRRKRISPGVLHALDSLLREFRPELRELNSNPSEAKNKA